MKTVSRRLFTSKNKTFYLVLIRGLMTVKSWRNYFVNPSNLLRTDRHPPTLVLWTIGLRPVLGVTGYLRMTKTDLPIWKIELKSVDLPDVSDDYSRRVGKKKGDRWEECGVCKTVILVLLTFTSLVTPQFHMFSAPDTVYSPVFG